MEVTISFIVAIIAEEESLVFRVSGANSATPTFKSIDPNFEVKHQHILNFDINQIVSTIDRAHVLGTGWKVSKRKFPSVQISTNYLIVLDPSER